MMFSIDMTAIDELIALGEKATNDDMYLAVKNRNIREADVLFIEASANTRQAIKDMRAYVEELEKVQDGIVIENNCVFKNNISLKQENTRLREALEEIYREALNEGDVTIGNMAQQALGGNDD